MIDIHYFNENIKLPKNIACIGCFDGVHRGHQQLIKKTTELAKKKRLNSMVITFKPDPINVFGPGHHMLTTLEERIAIFEKMGIDEVLIIDFNKKVMNEAPKEFEDLVLNRLNIDTLICGYDFTYGYKGQGNCTTLLNDGFNVIVIPEYRYYGKKISSTRIRKELEKKNYKFVNKMLGYEYKQ